MRIIGMRKKMMSKRHGWLYMMKFLVTLMPIKELR